MEWTWWITACMPNVKWMLCDCLPQLVSPTTANIWQKFAIDS